VFSRSVTILRRAKTAEPDGDAFWDLDSGGSGNRGLAGGLDLPMPRGNSGENVICIENDWLKEQDQQFCYNGIRVLEKCRTKCISIAGNYAEK